MWTTTTEPRGAVKNLGAHETLAEKGVTRGIWGITSGGIVQINVLDPNLPQHEFQGQLLLTSTRQGQFNKLAWKDYFSQHIGNPDTRTHLSKSHLKHFLFSKVKSWPGYS